VTTEPISSRSWSLSRMNAGVSQQRLTRLLDVSASSLRKWEQGIHVPQGAAATLLRVMEREPEAVTRTVLAEQQRGGEESHAR